MLLAGACVVEPELVEDDRGWFARTSCQREFAGEALEPRFVQSSLSFSKKQGTLRGMHYQAEPHPEAKLVRCVHGVIFAVVADLRAASTTYRRWEAVELSAENRHAVYVPSGCAFGFLTLADATEVFYQMSEFYYPELARGFRYDDPAFDIRWPRTPLVISERDLAFPPVEV